MTRIHYRNGLQTRAAHRLAARIEIRFPGRRPSDSVERIIVRNYGPRVEMPERTEAQRLAASLAIAADVADVQARRNASPGAWW